MSDRSGRGSPSVPSPVFTNEVFTKINDNQGFLNDELPFDLPDVDMEQCLNSKTDAPFEIDLSSLFTQSTYDAAPADATSLDIFGNKSNSQKPNCGYDACCESSAESTASPDGAVTLDMEKITVRKSKQTVKENLPNFTPLVLTGNFESCYVSVHTPQSTKHTSSSIRRLLLYNDCLFG